MVILLVSKPQKERPPVGPGGLISSKINRHHRILTGMQTGNSTIYKYSEKTMDFHSTFRWGGV